MVIKKVKNFIFLRDVFLLSFTAFGGPQAHFGTFLNLFVIKRHYLTEEDLIETVCALPNIAGAYFYSNYHCTGL